MGGGLTSQAVCIDFAIYIYIYGYGYLVKPFRHGLPPVILEASAQSLLCYPTNIRDTCLLPPERV